MLHSSNTYLHRNSMPTGEYGDVCYCLTSDRSHKCGISALSRIKRKRGGSLEKRGERRREKRGEKGRESCEKGWSIRTVTLSLEENIKKIRPRFRKRSPPKAWL